MWMVTTLSDLQQMVMRIDERQKLNGDSVTQRLDGIDQRVTRLEGFHNDRLGVREGNGEPDRPHRPLHRP